MQIFSLAAYNHSLKYGAPALAAFIASHNYFQSLVNGDLVNCAKWTKRNLNAATKRAIANGEI